MVKIGREIPDFEVGVFHNQEDKKIKLSDYRGKWMVLLFYPKDFTFVCPTELEDAASLYGEFQKLNAELLSVVLTLFRCIRRGTIPQKQLARWNFRWLLIPQVN